MNTKQVILAAIVAILAGAVGYYTGRQAAGDPNVSMSEMPSASVKPGESSATGREILYWVAPMNATEIYDKPGKSVMDMDLVPVYADSGGETHLSD